MGLLDFIGKPSDLTINAFLDTDRKRPVEDPSSIEVQFNPETIKVRYENAFQASQATPSSSAQARFSQGRSRLVSITLVFDGIDLGAYGLTQLLAAKTLTVTQRVDLFLRLCQQVNSESHEPSYLRLIWHKGVFGPNFDCRLKSVDINYTTFDADGSPLHAELAVQFIEDLAPKKKSALDNFRSPDLTHRRMVKAGDTLPLLCRDIYGTAEHYLRVAEANGLDDFRLLTPGQELLFPPYAKSGA
jgi:nucleoid-associated protein YgaU